MDLEELKARLRTGEDSRTEYKSVRGGFPAPEAITKETTAFANSGGGEIFFGVEDDGEVSGVGSPKDAERLQRHIAQANRDVVSPPLRVEQLVIEVEGHLVLIVRVPGYLPGRPFRGRSRYFTRDGPVAREASRDELSEVFASAGRHHYDEEVVRDATFEDLDEGAIRAYLAEARPPSSRHADRQFLHAIGALAEGDCPTVAGILLFGSEPQRFLRDAYVSAVRFPGRRMSRQMSDRREIEGTLLEQRAAAIAFLKHNVSTPARIEGTKRVESGLPEEVWREAVTNALVHRDYTVTSQIRIFVFDDRVEIANPGVLLNRLTIEGIRIGGISQRRNPLLAAALRRVGYAEEVGLGVVEIFELVREAGYPEPEIDLERGEFRLTIYTQPLAEPEA